MQGESIMPISKGEVFLGKVMMTTAFLAAASFATPVIMLAGLAAIQHKKSSREK